MIGSARKRYNKVYRKYVRQPLATWMQQNAPDSGLSKEEKKGWLAKAKVALFPSGTDLAMNTGKSLIVNYSAVMARATLSRALYAERYLLPMHLRSDFLVAWRVPRKLAVLLVPYRFN